MVSFDILINNEISDLGNKIFNKIKDLISIGSKQNDLLIKLINCGKEEIKRIVYSIIKKIKKESSEHSYNEYEFKEIEKKVNEYIVPTFSQDIICISKFSKFQKKYKKDLRRIYSIFRKAYRSNIIEFLQKTTSKKNIITYFRK